MSSVDNIQHGGTHYKSSYEHWNLVADLGLNYYAACASKYLTRHRKKNGEEDVLKTVHFLDKLCELTRSGKVPSPVVLHNTLYSARGVLVQEFLSANGINAEHGYVLEATALRNILMPMSVLDYGVARMACVEILMKQYNYQGIL